MSKSISIYPAWYVIWGNLATTPISSNGFILGRLAIYGTQPNYSPQQRYIVIGNIWLSNRRQLSKHLQVTDWQGTDEALVAWLWEKEGSDCLHRLEGIFSFVVWERRSDRLLLVRDPIGGKTLYYTYQNEGCIIAPRLKTLSPWHSLELNLTTLRDYLCTAFVPGERTFWQNVWELRPGMILSLPERTFKQYWSADEESEQTGQPIAWYSEKLRWLLEQTIRDYLPEREAVGVYLSGGLDSSCITALAAKFHTHPIHTYSIHFGSEYPNELEFSSLVAQHCQTQHHILEITPQQMWEQLPVTMANLDEPIGDPLTVPNYLLAQLARKDVRVILNGEGGDPCFGGPKNQPMLLDRLYNNSPDLLSVYLTSFQKCFTDLPQLLKPEVWQEVQSQTSVFAEDLYRDANYLNKLMLLNIKFKGSDHILTKVNNLTRSANLEGRSPLFDRQVVRFSLQIPSGYKLVGAVEKAVLKYAVTDLLPQTIIERPKSGMMVPVQLWFKKYWQRKARRLLLSKKAAIAPYLNQDLIRDWLNYQGDIWGRYGVKLWLLVSLEIWLQVNRFK